MIGGNAAGTGGGGKEPMMEMEKQQLDQVELQT